MKKLFIVVALLFSSGVFAENSNDKDTVFIFMSSSLSNQTLASYAKEAKDLNAQGLFRGIRKSDKTLMGFIKDVIFPLQKMAGSKGLGISIDPTAFDKFDVTSVPTLVFYDHETNTYFKSVGSTSIYYAKKQIENIYKVNLNLQVSDDNMPISPKDTYNPQNSMGFKGIFGNGKINSDFFKYTN